jgi:hypothetical protein
MSQQLTSSIKTPANSWREPVDRRTPAGCVPPWRHGSWRPAGWASRRGRGCRGWVKSSRSKQRSNPYLTRALSSVNPSPPEGVTTPSVQDTINRGVKDCCHELPSVQGPRDSWSNGIVEPSRFRLGPSYRLSTHLNQVGGGSDRTKLKGSQNPGHQNTPELALVFHHGRGHGLRFEAEGVPTAVCEAA